MHFPTDRTAHTTAFNGSVVDHWLEWKIAQTANASTLVTDANQIMTHIHVGWGTFTGFDATTIETPLVGVSITNVESPLPVRIYYVYNVNIA